MSQVPPPPDFAAACPGQVSAAFCQDERIYSAAAEFAETLSFSRLREFLSEATRWRSLLMLRH